MVRFAAYVALFPQLVAGPIERADSLLPQLKQKTQPRWAEFAEGLSLFEIGLFKKLALANYLAMYVDPIYADPERASGLALIVGTVAFSWQIYFDFSGYTDMARGVARFFGFRLMLRIGSPVRGSILITLAPRSLKIAPALGAAIQLSISMTVTSSRGFVMTTSKSRSALVDRCSRRNPRIINPKEIQISSAVFLSKILPVIVLILNFVSPGLKPLLKLAGGHYIKSVFKHSVEHHLPDQIRL